MSPRLGKLPWVWLSALVVVLDQISKRYFQGLLELYQRMDVIPGYFSWTLAYNKGAAFSFLAGQSGWQRWLFLLIAVAISLTLLVWLRRLKPAESWLAMALCLILGGAVGNCIDRLLHGQVVDFVLVHWHERWYFPAFNLADSAITVGVIMLGVDMLISGKREVSVHG